MLLRRNAPVKLRREVIEPAVFQPLAGVTGELLVAVDAGLDAGMQTCDRGYVMESGLITLSGDAKALLDNPDVRRAYLGE